jgi:hypothetical protein
MKMTVSSRRRVALVLCALAPAANAAAPAGTAAAAAPSTAGLSLAPVDQPSFLRFRAVPGRTVAGAIRVSNHSARPRNVRLQVTDLATAASGGIAFPDAAPRHTGRWLKLSTTELHLSSKSSRTVRLVGKVPEDAASGEHFGGVVAVDRAQLAEAATASPASPGSARGVSVRQITRLALPVKLTVPGPLSGRLVLRDVDVAVDAAGAGLAVHLRNTGNRILPVTDVDLRVQLGSRTLFRHRERLLEIVPDSSLTHPVRWQGRPAKGEYRVIGTIRPQGARPIRVDRQVRFDDDASQRLERATGRPREPTPTGVPIWMWAVVAGASALGLTAVAGYLRARRRLILAGG